MTNSAKPTNPVQAPGKLPAARVVDDKATEAERAARWRRGMWLATATLVLLGWGVIVSKHGMQITAPVVVLLLGWLAVVQAGWWLVGAAVAAAEPTMEHVTRDPWFVPIGKAEELQREKLALLKAIKEVEFDQQLGKMSAADAKELLAIYRARAIEVIKAIDGVSGGGPRAEIERELKARLEIAAKAKGNAAKRQGGKVVKGVKATKPDQLVASKSEPVKASPAATVALPDLPGNAKTDEAADEKADDAQAVDDDSTSDVEPSADGDSDEGVDDAVAEAAVKTTKSAAVAVTKDPVAS